MASGDTLPRLTSLPEYLPDALTDTQRRRSIATNRRKGQGVGLLSRLISGTEALVTVTMPLWNCPASDLYDHTVNVRARKVAAAVVGTAPSWNKLEHADTYLHLHILTSADAALLLPSGSNVKPVHNAEGLMRYLSKPADARACLRPVKDERTGQTITTLPPLDETLLEALEDYRNARARAAGRRLPRTSWTLNLPFMRADAAGSG